MLTDIAKEKLEKANVIKLFNYHAFYEKRADKFKQSKNDDAKEYVSFCEEVCKYIKPLIALDKIGSSNLLKGMFGGQIRRKAQHEKLVKWIKVECLGDWGYPAKPYLFKPVIEKKDDRTNKVWPARNETDFKAPFKLTKGELYMIPNDLKNKDKYYKEVSK